MRSLPPVTAGRRPSRRCGSCARRGASSPSTGRSASGWVPRAVPDADAAAEVTVLPVEKLGVDAAILFADILLLVEPLGVGLEFARGEGPVIGRPVRSSAAVERLVSATRQRPFPSSSRPCGARGPRSGPGASHRLCGGPVHAWRPTWWRAGPRGTTSRRNGSCTATAGRGMRSSLLARTTARYLNTADRRGRAAVQLFDSLGGALGPEDYRTFALPYTRPSSRSLPPGVPVIHFGTGTAGLLDALPEAGGDVIGVDWRQDLGDAWRRDRPDGDPGDLDPGGAPRAARGDPAPGGRPSSPRPPAGRGTSSTWVMACSRARRSTTRGRWSTPSMSCRSARRRVRLAGGEARDEAARRFGLWRWIEEHRRAFEPPVGNKSSGRTRSSRRWWSGARTRGATSTSTRRTRSSTCSRAT